MKRTFPYTWEKILSLAWFLILEDHNVISRFSKWGKKHAHPYGKASPTPAVVSSSARSPKMASSSFFLLDQTAVGERISCLRLYEYQYLFTGTFVCSSRKEQGSFTCAYKITRERRFYALRALFPHYSFFNWAIYTRITRPALFLLLNRIGGSFNLRLGLTHGRPYHLGRFFLRLQFQVT